MPMPDHTNEGPFQSDNASPHNIGGHSENDPNVDAINHRAGQTEPTDAGSINTEPQTNLGGLLDETIERFNDGP